MLLAKAPIRTLPIAGQRAAELRALALILAAKAFIFATALISYATQMGWYDRLFADAADGRHFGLEFWFSSWDSSHYIFLADHGYQHGLDGENAFAPLLPMAMRFLNLLTGNSVVSGLLIANIASVAAGFMFTCSCAGSGERAPPCGPSSYYWHSPPPSS
jgi:hypothetical protein